MVATINLSYATIPEANILCHTTEAKWQMPPLQKIYYLSDNVLVTEMEEDTITSPVPRSCTSYNKDPIVGIYTQLIQQMFKHKVNDNGRY